MAVKPLNRLQAFLAKIAGEPGPDVTPRNVTEYYLDKIADSGSGGGGGVSGIINVVSQESGKALDKTYNEIVAMIDAGALPFVKEKASGNTPGLYLLTPVQMYVGNPMEETYGVTAGGEYISDSPDGVLVYTE